MGRGVKRALCLLLVLSLPSYAEEGNDATDRASFASSLAYHTTLRAANVATTRWSLSQGAVEGNKWLTEGLEWKEAGIALALSFAETRMGKTGRRILRLVHLLGTVVTCVLDVRAGLRAMEMRRAR